MNKAGQLTKPQLNNLVMSDSMNQELILYLIKIYIMSFVSGIYKNVEINEIACHIFFILLLLLK